MSSQQDGVDLPFIGRGFGSILIVIILVAAVIVLALAGVLTGEAVAPIIAALAGYIFGASGNTTAAPAGRNSTTNSSG